jgi:hypothetical protein
MNDEAKGILGTLSPAYGLLSGQGGFGKLAPFAGVLPAYLDQDRKKNEEDKKIKNATSTMKKGGSIRGGGIESRGKTKGRFV